MPRRGEMSSDLGPRRKVWSECSDSETSFRLRKMYELECFENFTPEKIAKTETLGKTDLSLIDVLKISEIVSLDDIWIQHPLSLMSMKLFVKCSLCSSLKSSHWIPLIIQLGLLKLVKHRKALCKTIPSFPKSSGSEMEISVTSG